MNKKALLLIISVIGITAVTVLFQSNFRSIQEPSDIQTNEQVENNTTTELDRMLRLSDKDTGTQVYISNDLGVAFTYSALEEGQEFIIEEERNRVYLFDASETRDEGQWIEIFEKEDRSDNLQEAVERQIISRLDTNQCQNLSVAPSMTEYMSSDIEQIVLYSEEESDRSMCDTYTDYYNPTVPENYFFQLPQDPTRFFYASGGFPLASSGDSADFSWISSVTVFGSTESP